MSSGSKLLNDHVALVTGASRGIGRAIAIELANNGATIVGTATSAKAAMEIQSAFDGIQARGMGAVLDVTQPDACDALIADVERRFGTISILVNNAGITRDNLALRMKDEEWDVVLDTDLKAVFRLSRAVLRGMMKARRGRIINVTSIVGSSGNAGQVNYSAAKAGVAGMSRALAREIGSRNITVNCVAPGLIDTDMTSALPDVQRDALVAQIPLGRLGRAEEVAAVVTFLASPGAAYVTGATLHVNGGMYMA